LSERLAELERIREEVAANPKEVPRETRKYFWKLVRQIKRETSPNDDEILLAAEIRNILFKASRGGTYPLVPILFIELLGGVIMVWYYLTLLQTPLDWSAIGGWGLPGWGLFALRFMTIMAMVFFFYPFGRLIAGKWAGIEFEGMCRDQFYEPTLKIDYVSFLKARPPKRKWLFFFAGFWTILTSFLAGVLGFVLGGDITGFIPAAFLFLGEGYAVYNGGSKHTFGEMGHYNREKKIEKAWKKRLAKEQGIAD
jgi:hypothetical protein